LNRGIPEFVGILAAALQVIAVSACESATDPGSPRFHQLWYQAQTKYANASPAVSGNTVYFATGLGEVIARDVSTGAQKWIARASSQSVDGANLIVRSGIVVAPSVFETVGLDAQTGRGLWRYVSPLDTVDVVGYASPGSLVEPHIDADDDAVYIPAWGATISAIELRTGTVRWVWRPGLMEGDTAASGVFRSGSMGVRVSGDTVFATVWHATIRSMVNSEAWVVALDKHSGQEFWRVKLPFVGAGVLIWAAPVVYKNLVIVHTLSARTYAIDRNTQQIAWSFSVPGYTYSTTAGPALSGDLVYVDAGDGAIYALRAAEGSIVWRAPFSTETNNDMLTTDRNLIFTNGAELYVVNKANGRQLLVTTQPHTYDPLFASAPTAASGRVFINVADAALCFADP